MDKNRLKDAVKLVNERSGNNDKIAEYTDYRELLDRKDIDAVLISTPDHSHGMLSLAAVRAGTNAILELG